MALKTERVCGEVEDPAESRPQEDDELRRAFSAWTRQALMPAPFRSAETEPLAQLKQVRSMLAETMREWTKDWVAKGREEGLEKGREDGRAEERSLLCRQSASSDPDTAASTLASTRPAGLNPGSDAPVLAAARVKRA